MISSKVCNCMPEAMRQHLANSVATSRHTPSTPLFSKTLIREYRPNRPYRRFMCKVNVLDEVGQSALIGPNRPGIGPMSSPSSPPDPQAPLQAADVASSLVCRPSIALAISFKAISTSACIASMVESSKPRRRPNCSGITNSRSLADHPRQTH